jgi:predicted DNA-binding transcriptional regulator YafY
MRADRLVAILLLLQRRGQVTAAEVAAELEVSERTARRDLDALGVAGLPVYSVQGRGGGWRLAGGGTTDLSGLTSHEARALFLVAGPHAGATPEVRSALRKLIRALPEPLRDSAERASSSMVLDPAGWERTAPSRPPPPRLDEVQRGVVDGTQLRLGYVDRGGAASVRVVHPLGIAAKGATWYLIADTEAGMRTFRVDRVTSTQETGEPVVRPDGFDLSEAWQLVVDKVERMRTSVLARGGADASILGPLRMVLGTRFSMGAGGADGRVAVELRGHSIWSLAAEIAGFGAALVVDDPPEMRAALARVGAELTATYGTEVYVGGGEVDEPGT